VNKKGYAHNKIAKILSIIIVVLMSLSILGGCKPKEGENTDTKSPASTSSSPAKTTVKSAEKTTVKSPEKTDDKRETMTNSTAGTVSTSSLNQTPAAIGAESEKQDSITPDEEQDVETGSESAEISDPIKIFDLKGRVIKLLISQDIEKPQATGDKFADEGFKALKEAEELFNCKFEFEVIAGNFDTIYRNVEASILAGVYYVDSFRAVRNSVLPKYEKLGFILPLNDYINFDHPLWDNYDNYTGILYPDKIYSLNMGKDVFSHIGVWYNISVLEKEGYPDLHDYVDQNNWNWDTFLDIAINTTHDFDGNGTIDQWGIGTDSEDILGRSLLYSNMAVIIENVGSSGAGSYVYNLQSSQAMKSMQFFSDLYNTYRVVTHGQDKMRKSSTAMYVSSAWYGINWRNAGLTNLGFVQIPNGPDNPEGKIATAKGGGHSFFFPVTLQDPEAVINAVAYWHAYVENPARSAYVTYNDKLMSSALQWMYTQRDIDNYLKYCECIPKCDYINYFKEVSKLVINNVFKKASTTSTTASSAIASIKDQAADIIEQVMSK